MHVRFALSVFVLSAFTILSSVLAEDPYESIPLEPMLNATRIIRPDSDQLLVGQIVSAEGAAAFQKRYGVAFETEGIDFEKQMLMFGITDLLHTRVFRLLLNRVTDTYVLDYRQVIYARRLRPAGKGKKYSFVQVFATDRNENMLGNVSVKNVVYGQRMVFRGEAAQVASPPQP